MPQKSHVRFSSISLIALIVAFIAVLIIPVYANDLASIGNSVVNGMDDIYKLILTIVLPVAAIVVCVNALKIFTGTKKDEAFRNIFVCLAVVAIVMFAPTIVQTVGSWFEGGLGIQDLKPAGGYR